VNKSEYLDLDLLQGYLDNLGDSVVQQMLKLYISQSAIYIADISSTVSPENQKDWHENCHKMKGAAGSVGLLQVHKKLVAIERLEDDESTKNEHVSELNRINTDAINKFSQWLSKAV